MKKFRIPTYKQTFYGLAVLLLISCTVGCQQALDEAQPSSITPATTKAARPALTGKMVFHRYADYGGPAQMYTYNFQTNTLTFISQNWNLHDPINGHFNFNGTKLVFMAQTVPNAQWDIFLWDVGSSTPPRNLTANNGLRNEDPKFSPNGFRICFKQSGQLKIMDLNGTITNNVTNSAIECGMPYYSDDATALIYSKGSGAGSNVYIINIDGTNDRPLATVNNVQEYYPVVLGPSTFLYSRWVNANNKHDQVYLGSFTSSTRTRLPFNTTNAEYADAYPCGTNKVIISSTRAGGKGDYDLYIADSSTGQIWSLTAYNATINSTLKELGAAYSSQ